MHPRHPIASRVRIRRARFVLAASLLLAAAPLRAQERPSTFSLDDALAVARERHPLLRAARGRQDIAVGTARQDAALPNPVFELRRENIGAPIPADVFATLSIGTDAFARRFALRGLVGSVVTRAAADSAAAARTIEFDVARAYWRTAVSAAVRDAAESERAAFDTLAITQARRAREGAIAEGAAMRTRLESDRVRLAARSAAAEAERARGELARALALALDATPWPTERADLPILRLMTDRAVAVASTAALETDVASVVARARAQRPELVAARARLEEAQQREHAEALGRLPSIGAVAGLKRTAGYNTGVAGIIIGLPVFDRNGGARTRARGEAIVAESELRALDAQVGAEVAAATRALASLESAGTNGATGPFTLDASARDVVDVTLLAYREGTATLLELLDAVRARWEVRIAALRWAGDLRLAQLDLERAMGTPANGSPIAASGAPR